MRTFEVLPTTQASVVDQIRAELIKVRSARSLWLLPLLTVLFGPATAVFVGLTDSLDSSDTVLGGALTALPLSLALMAAWGVLVITTEFSSGTIRPVLAATPRRGTVLLAKIVVVGSVAAVVGVLATTLAYVAGLGSITAGKYEAGEPFPGLVGIYGCFPAVALLGLGVGIALRSSVGAIAVVTAHVVVPQLSSAQVFGDLHKWVTIAAPSAVVSKLSQSSEGADELIGSLGGWPRLAIVVAGTVGALMMARRTFEREDI